MWRVVAARRRARGNGSGTPLRDALAPAGTVVPGRHGDRRGLGQADGRAPGAGARLRRPRAHAGRSATQSPRICAMRWGIAAAAPPTAAPTEELRRTRFADYAHRIREARRPRPERLELVERLWTVAFVDGVIGEHEDRLMDARRRAARAQGRRAGRRAAAPAGATPMTDDRRRRCGSASTRDFGLEGFRDFLALESGHSANTVEAYLRDLRGSANSPLGKGVREPAGRSPGRCCATSSTCSRIWA